MQNPWLKIPASDYEEHMTLVGQAQVLNRLTKEFLEKYRPGSFALLGCATGNGLEHVNPEITHTVYAIDINPEYLAKTKERFEGKFYALETLNINIQEDALSLKNIDLFFVGLVLEYVEPEGALRKIIRTLSDHGKLVIVIQKNNRDSFVSETKYKSLEKLGNISKEVDERMIDRIIRSENRDLLERDEIKLTENKSFVVLEYGKR